MNSKSSFQQRKWHQTSIDDIIAHCDSLSLSSSEADNITLDSGIGFDNNSDIFKHSVVNNQIPPPPPPYESSHNIIPSDLVPSNSNECMKLPCDKLVNNMSYSCEVQSFEKCNSKSINNYNKDFNESRSVPVSKRYPLSRLLTEDFHRLNINNKKSEKKSYFDGDYNNFSQINKNRRSPIFERQSDFDNTVVSSNFQPQITSNANHIIHIPQCSFKNSSVPSSPTFSFSKQKVSGHSIERESSKEINVVGTCNKCKDMVTDYDSACVALGKLYHSKCFVCCYCNRSLKGQVFYKDQEKIYCESDYMVFGFHKSLKVCNACGHMITEQILEAIGKDFHPRCFKCKVCQKCLDGVPFTVDRNNNIYCIPDYHKTFAPRCVICCQPITPYKDSEDVVRIIVNDKDFHIGCYRCQNCSKLLTNDSNCFLWTADKSSSNMRLLCRYCYVGRFREIFRLQ